jgi:Cys-tRNA(Pro)/Cys-tRNA(Cys) deacylase
MANTSEKTNVLRLVESMKLPYREYHYTADASLSGADVAKLLGQDPEQVFKTLVTTGKTGAHYVFMIPVEEELDLKKAAKAVGEKSIEMLKSKDLLGLTGYIHGGCSPIGMKKQFPTTVQETAQLFDTIVFSAGRIGSQIELSPEDLEKIVPITYADLTKE